MNEKLTSNEKLRRARETRGWTQEELAEKIGVNPVSISLWEHGLRSPSPEHSKALCDIFGINPEELGFVSSSEERSIATMPESIEFTVQEGDITTFEADVVALKYAQDFYGADQTIAYKLAERGILLENLRPPIGQYRYVETKGSIAAHAVLFVGVPALGDFGYEQIREFPAQVLNLLALGRPDTRYLAMTVHGVGFGLDEVEAIRAQFAGYMDAIQNGNIPSTLKKITIVDIHSARVQRLRQALENGLA